ncbi:MAG: hypothetical protein H0S85_02670 [Desulfovibrionaceae bacterium]|jgi:mono/diheme cytochrome c family protein|nr:hypothetical protein [Desulfovibrionaceae bacterium]
MHRFACIVPACAVLVLALWAGPSAESARGAASGQALVTGRCTGCHGLERVCAMLGVKDRGAWAATVARMRRNGLQVRDAEAAEVAAWLSGLARGAGPVCP